MLPVTDESKIHDVAVLKIEAAELPHVTLGDWSEIQEADAVTVIASLYGYGSHLIVTGIVAAKGNATVKPKAPSVRTIIFQAPVRGGFSGAPVFSNATGHVIGIQTTKVFGISKKLDSTRETLAKGVGDIKMGAFSLVDTVKGLIDTLHDDLISGLGSAVDISYAKEMQVEIQNKKN